MISRSVSAVIRNVGLSVFQHVQIFFVILFKAFMKLTPPLFNLFSKKVDILLNISININ